jgi:tetratricopeptide (TPR) repeat protein
MWNQKVRRQWVLAVILLWVVFILSGCTSMEAKRDKFLASGKELYQKGDYLRARLQFRNALQIDPKYAEGCLWLGKTELKLNNFQGAFGSLSQAAELKPDLTEAQILLGQIFLMARKPDDAETKINLALKQEPDNTEALLLAASLAMTREQTQKGLDLLEKVRRLDPHKINAYLLQSLIQAKQQQPEAAAKTLEEGLKANPKAIELYLARANLADSQKQFEMGEATLLKATALEPKNTRLQSELARHYISADQWDKAEETLRRNLSLEPDKEAHAVTLARFLAKRDRPKEGEQTLKDFVGRHPDNLTARFALADFYLSLRRVGAGTKILQEIAAADPSGPKGLEALDKLALLSLERGQIEEAEKLVGGVLKDNSKDMEAILLQGQIALVKKDGLKAVNNFRIITQDQPKNPEAWLLLARAHKLNGEPEQAKEQAKKALVLKPDFLEARTFLYGMFLEAKDYEGAIQTIKGYLRFNDKDVFNLTALGDVYMQKGDYAQAQGLFQQVVNLDPKKPQGYFSLGLLNRQQKQPEQALKYFEQALAQQLDFLPALQQEVGIYAEQKQLGRAVEAVRQDLARSPKNPQIQQLLGELLLVQKQPEAAAKVLEEAIAINPNPQTLRLLIVAYLQQPDQDLLLPRLEERAADPKAPPYSFLILSGLYEQKKDFDKAKAVYETLLTKDLFPDLARNNLAYLLAEHYPTPENLERALKLSSESLQDNPGEPGFQDTLGWVLCQRGEYTKAETYLEKAVSKAPNNPSLYYHLGWCEVKMGETTKAQETLKKALSLKTEFPERAEAQKLLESLPAGKP